jgi:CRISPR-associated protein Csm5
MVWKDQVNVLDQRRIFRLLAKGPRLDNYLTQLKRADKLDFASWGGFAQNFAGRRIPFEHASSSAHWERARTEHLHIPTFASSHAGPYLPGSALKGALRTGMVFAGLKEGSLEKLAAQFQTDRPPRRPAEDLEERVLGSGGSNRMRRVQISDSDPVPVSSFKVYMLRVASLRSKGKDGFALGWKQSPTGTADGGRPEDGAVSFAEMALPGTLFEGVWHEPDFLSAPEIVRALNWREPLRRSVLFAAVNRYSQALIEAHKRYAEVTGLSLVGAELERLEGRLAEASQSAEACLLPIGWGGGLLARVAWLKTDDAAYREIITQSGIYGRSVYPGFPFPKTRRIVFLENRPATLPGWALLEVAG